MSLRSYVLRNLSALLCRRSPPLLTGQVQNTFKSMHIWVNFPSGLAKEKGGFSDIVSYGDDPGGHIARYIGRLFFRSGISIYVLIRT